MLILLTGCTSYVHKKPDEVTITNEKTLNQPMEKVWSSLFNQLYNDSFTVNSTDKNTGIIVVSFKTDRPVNYIDCGIVKTNYRANDKVNHEYIYNYADSISYLYNHNGKPYKAEVESTLEATITGKVFAEGANNSTVIINVDYKLIRNTNATNETDKTSLPVKQEIFEFTTTAPYKSDKVSCTSTGAIENNLLDSLN